MGRKRRRVRADRFFHLLHQVSEVCVHGDIVLPGGERLREDGGVLIPHPRSGRWRRHLQRGEVSVEGIGGGGVEMQYRQNGGGALHLGFRRCIVQ